MPVENALAGQWVALDQTILSLTVEADSQHRFGIVRGFLTTNDTAVELTGFTDINAVTSKLALQSVSLTVTTTQDGAVSTLCGTLDFAQQTLNLLVLASSPVRPLSLPRNENFLVEFHPRYFTSLFSLDGLYPKYAL